MDNLIDDFAQTIDEPLDNNEEIIVIDSRINISILDSNFKAIAKIIPPENGGKYLTIDNINEALEENSIVYGIDEEKIKEIANRNLTGQFTLAKGKKPIDGKDGKVTELFERNRIYVPTERSDGTIDYKNLHLIDEVKKGDIVIELIQPIDGINGMDVFGNEIEYKSGIMPEIPIGNNLSISECQTKVVADIDGFIKFKDKKFHVENVFVVNSDVDASTGDIFFSNDIVIKGDVLEGYKVKSKANILIEGTIFNGIVEADGNITIKNGINGGYKGILNAGGDIDLCFIENAIVHCRGNITAETIINSKVYCDGYIKALKGKGVIIGGILNAFSAIECKTVGSIGNVYTEINLGFKIDLLNDFKNLSEQLRQLKFQLVQINKNIEYLENKLKIRPLTYEEDVNMNTLKKQKPVNILHQRRILKKINEIKEELNNDFDCFFKTSYMYAPFKVIVKGKSVAEDIKDYKNVHISIEQDELKIVKV